MRTGSPKMEGLRVGPPLPSKVGLQHTVLEPRRGWGQFFTLLSERRSFPVLLYIIKTNAPTLLVVNLF
jgi:hypothetical protein